ncbi:MAG: hypothetical protein QF464_18715, partial [Myxococcota bacterium]|nr:hypothetical protein [Myxococcota bacterium]
MRHLGLAIALGAASFVLAPDSARAEELCVSVGHPANGWLMGAVALPGSERLQVRDGRNFGTGETVEAILAAVDAVHEAHPGAHRLVTGDLSR